MRDAGRRIANAIAGLSRREQVLLCCTVAVLLIVVLHVLVIQPYDARRQAQERHREALREEIAALDGGIERSRTMADDPAGNEWRARRRQLERALDDVEQVLLRHTAALVAPTDMATLLHDVLSAQTGVTLLRLENVGPEQVGSVEGPVLFRHGLVLELRADYLGMLRFLEALERLPWRFLWDELEYRLESYPDARIKMRLSTLSAHEEWIGV